MCGIVGLIAKAHNGLYKQTETSFLQMLLCDVVRGEDSTGIIAVENDSTFHVVKDAVASAYFLDAYKRDHGKISNAMWSRGKVYIGHNRKKTSGTITPETAHPFVVDKRFAMVHNGTLFGHKHLAKTEVDSEALAIHLSKAIESADENGQVGSAIEKALGEVYGAYAIAMYDQKMHKVYLLRNKDRPLSFIEVPNAYYFFSEPLMGAWILARNDYKYAELEFQHLLEHQLVTIDLKDNKVTKELLSPKKSTLPATNNQVLSIIGQAMATAGKVTSTTSESRDIAANKGTPMKGGEKELKKFRNNWLGKRITFWADDFLEKNFPRTIEEHGETEVVIMGAHDEVKYWHNIQANVDMSKLGMKYPEDITSKKWTGTIETVSVTASGCVQIYIGEGCKPLAPALTMHQINEIRMWKCELDNMRTEEIEKYRADYRKIGKFPVWKESYVEQVLTWRKSIESIEQANQLAFAKDGTILHQENVDGHFVYVDDKGKIYYESSITVH